MAGWYPSNGDAREADVLVLGGIAMIGALANTLVVELLVLGAKLLSAAGGIDACPKTLAFVSTGLGKGCCCGSDGWYKSCDRF